MILPVAYAMLVWIVLYAHRGRWVALLLLILSLVPPAALTLTASYTARLTNVAPSSNFFVNNLAGMGMIFHLFTGGYAILLLSVGLVIAVQKPVDRSALHCLACKYDLSGNESGTCPECGAFLTYEQVEQLARSPRTPKHPGAAPDFASDVEAESAGRRHERPRRIPAHLTSRNT